MRSRVARAGDPRRATAASESKFLLILPFERSEDVGWGLRATGPVIDCINLPKVTIPKVAAKVS